MLRNAVGVSAFPEKKRYGGVRFNVISVTRGWVWVKFPGKKRYANGPFVADRIFSTLSVNKSTNKSIMFCVKAKKEGNTTSTVDRSHQKSIIAAYGPVFRTKIVCDNAASVR